MAQQKIKLGHSIAACKSLQQLLDRHPGLFGKLPTTADRTYIADGLQGAIQHLEWLLANEAAIRAALAALAQARKSAGCAP